MNLVHRAVVQRLSVALLTLLACVSLFAQPASAQHHRKHRHVVVRRVRRHGHWVTVRSTVWR